MPMTLAGPSTSHESDSEEDLDYVPDDEGHGIVHIQNHSGYFAKSPIQFRTLALMSVARNVLALKAHRNLIRT
jgi:hypothetical protein